MKNIIKEVFIMLLLLTALILIFGIVFYDYVPNNKVIPNNVDYKLPDEIAKELAEFSVEENAPLNIVYEVTGSEMKGYEKGKVNPYAALSSGNVTGGNENTATSSGGATSSSSSASTNETNTNTTANTNTTNSEVPKGTFFENGTTK